MKKIVSFFWLLLIGVTALSQKSEKQIIEDSVYGWFKVYNFKANEYKPQVANGRTYSSRQKSYVDSFANWIQASYIPKGGLGDVKRKLISPKSDYVSLESLPQAYGATAFTWAMSVNKATGKHEIIRETEIPFGVFANEVIGMPIHVLCTPAQYFFTRPGTGDDRFRFVDGSLRSKYDITKLPQLKKYITFYSEASNYDRNASLVDAVLLSKDNRMPFIAVSKGEYLDLLSDALERAYQKDVDYAEKQWSAGAARDNVLNEARAKKDKRRLKIAQARERYKGRLTEVATVTTAQPGILLENYEDIFEGNGGAANKYTIYKVDPEMAAKCKEDTPQWILFTWYWEADDPKLVHMHESIINNFNFDYVYDFFFSPQKVKGLSYKPLRNPYPAKSANNDQNVTAAKKPLPGENVVYFEDFSTSPLNQKPADWYSEISGSGVQSKVSRVDGLQGNWLVIKGNKVSPLSLPKPMPSDFSLSFDVAVPQGFTWGAKGLELVLNQNDKSGKALASIWFKIRPGFDGRDGFTSLESAVGKNNKLQDGAASGFSNNKPVNLVPVIIEKKGDQLTIKVNAVVAHTLSPSLQAGTIFNQLYFKHISSDADSEKYYISNIRIEQK